MDKIKIGTLGTVVSNSSDHEFKIGQRVKFYGYDEYGDQMWEDLDGSASWWIKDGDVEIDQ